MSNKVIYVCLAVFAVILVTSIVTSSSVSVKLNGTYSDDNGHFSVKHPTAWETKLDEDKGLVMFISPVEDAHDGFREMVVVGSMDLGEPLTLEGAREAALADFDAVASGFRVLEEEDGVLGGLDAIRMVCRARIDGHLIQYLMYITAKGSRIYYISCMTRTLAYDKYVGAFEDFARSMMIE